MGGYRVTSWGSSGGSKHVQGSRVLPPPCDLSSPHSQPGGEDFHQESDSDAWEGNFLSCASLSCPTWASPGRTAGRTGRRLQLPVALMGTRPR